MTLKELLDAAYNSDMEEEVKAEISDIISAYQRQNGEEWDKKDELLEEDELL